MVRECKTIGSKLVVYKAYLYAASAHFGQKDDCGEDYFKSHCEQVYDIIRILYPMDYNLQAAALLHDTVEDTDLTYKDLLNLFGQDVADLVMEVTHERNSSNTGWYFPRLKTIRGYVLKFADRDSNLSRMEGAWDSGKIQKYLDKSTFWKTTDW